MYNSWGGDEGQIESWSDFNQLRWTILHGRDREENALLESDIFLINPEGLDWFFNVSWQKTGNKTKKLHMNYRRMKNWGRVMLVVDESTKFKAHDSNRSKILQAALGKFTRRYILTGTPDPNGLIDLFGQIYILDEGDALGRYITHFRNRYFYPSGFGGYTWSPQPDALERITERISPLVLRMEAKDYLKLPELTEVKHLFDLPPNVRAIYKEMEDELVIELEGEDLISANQAVGQGRCRQITAGAIYRTDALGDRGAHILHEEKLDIVEELIEELGGAPLLVFYEFEFERGMYEERFAKICKTVGKSPAKDQVTISAFNRGEIKMLLIQQATAMGLNLQKSCAHVFFTSQTWKADDHRQCIDRVRRQGNPNLKVFAHYAVARETVDEIVYDRVVLKHENSANFAEALKRLRQN
jgi:SNF2 family DNA or RNA helicase